MLQLISLRFFCASTNLTLLLYLYSSVTPPATSVIPLLISYASLRFCYTSPRFCYAHLLRLPALLSYLYSSVTLLLICYDASVMPLPICYASLRLYSYVKYSFPSPVIPPLISYAPLQLLRFCYDASVMPLLICYPSTHLLCLVCCVFCCCSCSLLPPLLLWFCSCYVVTIVFTFIVLLPLAVAIIDAFAPPVVDARRERSTPSVDFPC